MGEELLDVPDYGWNVWKINPKTGALHIWLGMIRDPRGGFEWRAKQKQPHLFKINNVPPPNGRTQNPPYVVEATSVTTKKRGPKMEPRYIPGKSCGVCMAPTGHREGCNAEAMKAERRAARNANNVVPLRKVEGVTSDPARPLKVKPDTPEMKQAKAEAAKVLDKHKADEVAEFGKQD